MIDCIFCKISRGEINSEKIYENDNFFSIPDAKPVTDGHSLVISKKHFDNSLELPIGLSQELNDCIKNTSIILMKKYNAEGFNLVNNNFKAAGQVVFHIHYHIIPRKEGDGLKILH